MLFDPYRPGAPTVVRLRATSALDSYGDPVESWATPDRLPLPGAEIQRRETVETDSASRQIVRVETVLFAPGAADVTEDDRIEVDGDPAWRVDGSPSVERGFLGTHTTARLLRLTGGRA